MTYQFSMDRKYSNRKHPDGVKMRNVGALQEQNGNFDFSNMDFWNARAVVIGYFDERPKSVITRFLNEIFPYVD